MFFTVSIKHAPIKEKCFRTNEALFVIKELHVAIMKRSRIRNKFLREKNQADRDNYKFQRNLCKKPLRKTKTSYLSNLDTKKITDSITFWKKVIPLFTSKPSKSENIIIIEGDKSISHEKTFVKYLIIVYKKADEWYIECQ